MLKMNTIFYLPSVYIHTVMLEPGMPVFCNQLLLCQTILLGVNQMHVVVSLGASWSPGQYI